MKNRRQKLVLGALLFVLSACSDVTLKLANFPVTLAGEYCTDDSEVYELPTRILLIIDTSRSMETNDPESHRGKAAAELISHFSDSEMVSFGFVTFNTSAIPVTNGFTRDQVELTQALNELSVKEGFTNYLDALAAAQTMVDDDISKVRDELSKLDPDDPERQFLRPWYFVVFLSDGFPRMPGGVVQNKDQIDFRVRELVDVPPEAAGLTLHTAFLGAKDDAARPKAERVLSLMAARGGGVFTSFETGADIDFSVFDFVVTRRYDIKQFIVYNRSVVLTNVGPQPDSDQDGLSDAEELERGTELDSTDSDGDGCSDGFEVTSGLDPTKLGSCNCSVENRDDVDKDGLLDCEEVNLGFDRTKFDTDRDLFPDWFELRMGTNAADYDDSKEDLDFDGKTSGEEILIGTDPKVHDTAAHRDYGYRYHLHPTTPVGAAQVCYTYRIENISLGSTLGTAEHQEGMNTVVLETVESPEDDPDGVFALRRRVLQLEFGSTEGVVEVSADGEFETISTDLRSSVDG
jgi:hypothetical protein